MGKNQWVVKHGDKWAVKGEGIKRLLRSLIRKRKR